MYTTDKTIDDVIDALGDFIELFVSGAEIIRGEVNRVPHPDAPFVVLTELFSDEIERPKTDWTPAANTITITAPTRFDIQADFYGEAAGDYCKAIKQAIRTGWGFDQFPDGIKPLYTDQGHQAPLVTGEQQYMRRWILTISMQYNPAVDVSQQFADEASVSAIEPVDVFY